jgi:KaiC/GvpD/RAD55 family RecA-like ATPase
MYELDPVIEGATVDPGTNVLVSGPPLTGKRKLGMELLAKGANNGEGSVIVTTRDSADRVVADYRSLLDRPDETPFGVVDSVTQHQGRAVKDSPTVKYASSPVDMTGIGIKFSEYVEEFYTSRGLERNRVMLDSLSTLLMYADLQTVFRFMHVFTSRIESADALGIYTIESTAHDAEATSTLKQLFDGVVEIGETAGDVSVQLPGPDTGVSP